MLNTVDGPSDPVEDYLCDPEEMPLGTREGRLPCPEDCVLSDWTPWSPCNMVRGQQAGVASPVKCITWLKGGTGNSVTEI